MNTQTEKWRKTRMCLHSGFIQILQRSDPKCTRNSTSKIGQNINNIEYIVYRKETARTPRIDNKGNRELRPNHQL